MNKLLNRILNRSNFKPFPLLRQLVWLWMPAFLMAGHCSQAQSIQEDIAATPFPVVVYTSPAGGYDRHYWNSGITITFNKDMDAASVESSVVVEESGTPIAGTTTYVDIAQSAIFVPAANFPRNRWLDVTVTTGAMDASGVALPLDFTFSFRTRSSAAAGVGSDIVAPFDTFVFPVDGSAGLATDTSINITFNEDINPTTLMGAWTVTDSSAGPVSGQVFYVAPNKMAMFFPQNPLQLGESYTFGLDATLEDMAGNNLSAQTWSFTTEADTAGPVVSVTSPVNTQTGVPTNAKVTVTFNESIDAASLTGNFIVEEGGLPIAGGISYDDASRTAVFTPTPDLTPSSSFLVTVVGGPGGVADLSGNVLAADYSFTFSTATGTDSVAPIVMSSQPINGATDTTLNSQIVVNFSETMNPGTINAGTLTVNDGSPVAGNIYYDALTNSAVFEPAGFLAASTVHTVTMSASAADLAGNTIGSDYMFTFTTGNGLDYDNPSVILQEPADGQYLDPNDLAINSIAVAFSEAMQSSTINSATVLVHDGTDYVDVDLDYQEFPGPIYGLLITAPSWDFDKIYTATVTTEVKDLAGNPMLEPHSWTFGFTNSGPNPVVYSVQPVHGDMAVVHTSEINVVFDRDMNSSSINSGSFIITPPVSGTFDYNSDNYTVTFTPDSELPELTAFTVTLTSDIEDNEDNLPLLGEYNWSFTTPARPEAIVAPPSNSLISDGQPIIISFDRSMDPGTLALGGTLAPSATIGWSTSTNVNDTLTLSPTPTWPGDFQTLVVDVQDIGALPITTLNLDYGIVVGNIIYVHPAGSDSNVGSAFSPVATIQTGIDIAAAIAAADRVHVAEGTYNVNYNANTQVKLQPGVSVYGGYDATDWASRNAATYQSHIVDLSSSGGSSVNPTRAVEASHPGLSTTDTLDGFHLTAGSSNYASQIYISEPVTISSNVLQSTVGGGSSYGIFNEAPAIIDSNIIQPRQGSTMHGIFEVDVVGSVITNNFVRVEGYVARGYRGLRSQNVTLADNTFHIDGGNAFGLYFIFGQSNSVLRNRIQMQSASPTTLIGISMNLVAGTTTIGNNTVLSAADDNQILIHIVGGGTKNLVNNTLFVAAPDANGSILEVSSSFTDFYIENNLFYGASNIDCIVQNNAFFSFTTVYNNSFNDFDHIGRLNYNTFSSVAEFESAAITEGVFAGGNVEPPGPVFLDPDGPDDLLETLDDNDLHLQPATSCQTAQGGLDLSGQFTEDFDLVTRTVPWSIGAYEYDGGCL